MKSDALKHLYLIGADGNVGSAVSAAFASNGWQVAPIEPYAALPALPGAVVMDAGPPGPAGWEPASWSNYFGAVERAVRIIGQAERAGYAAVVLCATPWITVRAQDPYADSKALIEDIARAHNRHGRTFVLVDRIGMQNPMAQNATRFEESVRQQPGELGERILASLELALASR